MKNLNEPEGKSFESDRSDPVKHQEIRDRQDVRELDRGLLFQDLFLPYYRTTSEGVLLSYNQAFCLVLGIEPTINYEGVSIAELLDELSVGSEYAERIRKDGLIRDFEIKPIKNNGVDLRVFLNARVFVDPINGASYIEGTLIHLPKTPCSASALRTDEWLWTAFDNMLQGIQIIGRDWTYLYINNTAELHNRRSREELLGKVYMEMWPGVEDTEVYVTMRSSMLDGNVRQLQNRFVFPDGSSGWYDLSIQPIEEGILIHSVEITKRKKAEEEVRKKERILDLLTEYAPASIAMFDLDMRYIVTSKRYLKDYGLGDSALTGKSHYQVFPEIPERWKKIHKKCLAGASESASADPFLRESGKTDWVRWDIRPWYELDGTVGGIILFSEVITEQIRIMEELKSEKDRFVKISEAVPGLICSFSLDTTGGLRLIYSSVLAKDVLGFDVQEIIHDPSSLIQRIHPGDVEMVKTSIKNSAKNLAPWRCEYRYQHPAKGDIWLEVNSVPSKGTKSHAIWHGFITDITKRKKAEISLKEKEVLLSEVGRMAKIGGWEFDIKTGEGSWTEEVARIHDMATNEPTNLKLALSFFRAEHRKKMEEAVKETIQNGRKFDLELELTTGKGKRKWIRTMGRAVKKNDNTERITGSFQDVTTQKKISDQLKQYHDRLEELVKIRTRELEMKNKELHENNKKLERLNELFVDREFRIKELKDQLRELNSKQP